MELLLTLFGILALIIFFFRFIFKIIAGIFVLFLKFPIFFIGLLILLFFLAKSEAKTFKYKTYQNNSYQRYYQNTQSQKFDYYCNILGVSKDFTKEELKQKFREKTKLYHPDKNQENKEYYEEKYKEIVEAYEELSKAR